MSQPIRFSTRTTPHRRPTIWPWLRLLLSLLLLLLALPAVLQVPNSFLFYIAFGATEYGHWFALGALAVLALGWRSAWLRPALGALGTGLSLLALILFSSAAVRAMPIAHALPAQLDKSFGSGSQVTAAQPYALTHLFTGVSTPHMQPQTLVYATHNGAPLKLDFYPAQAKAPAPLVLVVHGGSWRGSDRTEFPALNPYLAARGYAVAAIDYRLAPKLPDGTAHFPQAKADVADAITYLKAHAAELGVDPQKIVLLGRSAGAELALVTAYSAHDRAINGVISLYGPVDLAWGYEFPGTVLDSRNILAAYLGGSPTQVPDMYTQAEPDQLLSGDTPPTLLIQGVRDEMVAAHHSEKLDAALASSTHTPHLLVELPWATHGCDFNFSGPCGQLSTYAIERFLAFATHRTTQ